MASKTTVGSRIRTTVRKRLPRRIRSKIGEYGRPYRGREGQWSWIAHRVTGVAIFLFLWAHIVDTAVVGWGPDAYDKVVAVYHNPLIRLLELGLVAAVLYHALNGVRIMLVDFFPALALRHRILFYWTMAVFVTAMIPITWIIGKPAIEQLFR